MRVFRLLRRGSQPLRMADGNSNNAWEQRMDIGLIIDGIMTPASSGAAFDRKDPVTGAVATRAAAASVADVEKAASAAANAFEAWSQTGPGERRALLLKAASLLEERTGEFTK